MTPFVVVIKKQIDRREENIRAQLRYAKAEYKYRHPYDELRTQYSPLAFAEYVLREEKLLEQVAGADFLDGKYATPLMKIKAANEVLKRKGLAQINKSKEWTV